MRQTRLQVLVNEKELGMIGKIQGMMGGVGRSEAIRDCIRYRFDKYFPPYKLGAQQARSELEPKLTPEQLCERAGGVVTEKEGLPVCAIKVSESMTRFIPLSKPELLENIK